MEFYKDLPLLVIKPNFADKPKLGFDRDILSFSANTGRTIGVYNSKNLIRSIEHSYVFIDQEDEDYFDELFDYVGGRAGDFYIISWLNQMEFKEASKDLSNSYITVSNCNYGRGYDNIGISDVFLLNDNYELFTGSVESYEEGEENTVLTIDSLYTADYKAGNCIVGFIYRVRFADDNLNKVSDGTFSKLSCKFRQIVPLSQAEYINFSEKLDSYYEVLETKNHSWSGSLTTTVVETETNEDDMEVFGFEWSGKLHQVVVPHEIVEQAVQLSGVSWSGKLQNSVVTGFYNSQVSGYVLGYALGHVLSSPNITAPFDEKLSIKSVSWSGSLNAV